MRLLVLSLALLVATATSADLQDDSFCSHASLETLCLNQDVCSKLITQEMREQVCPMFQSASTATPTSDNDLTPSVEEFTTTAVPPSITTYATEELIFTTDRLETDPITSQEIVTSNGFERSTEAPQDPDITSPVIIGPPVNITVKPGEAGRFECTAKGAPSPQITITKKEDVRRPVFNDVFLGASRVQSQTAENLIKNVAKSNEGWYTCQACNPHGCEEHDAYLHVLDLCEGVTCPGLQECVGDYESGFGYSCECTLPCDPLMMVQDAPVCTNYCEDKSNECKMKLDSCQNNMLDVEVMSAGRCPEIVEPSILDATVQGPLELQEEDALSLLCLVEGSPEPSITWYHNGAVVGYGNELTFDAVYSEHEGEYVCEATNCKNKIARKTIAFVTVLVDFNNVIVDAPRSTCSVTGEPHFLTYDSHSYSYSGVCDNLLAMDCQNAAWFVYGRMTPCGDNGSCLEAVTLYIGSESIELQRGWLMNRYGKKIVTKNHIGELIALENSEHQMTAVFDGSNLRLTAILSEEEVSPITTISNKIVIDWDGYVSVQIQTPRATPTCGMCGNNDGLSGDNLVSRGGRAAGSVEEFGDSWQVDPLGKCPETSPRADLVELCGDRVEQVRRECEGVFHSPKFTACKEIVGHDTDHFVRSCMADQCKGQFTRLLEPRCVVAQAYATRCAAHFWRQGETSPVFNWDVAGWEADVGCPGPVEREEVIVGTGCPQPATIEEETTWVF